MVWTELGLKDENYRIYHTGRVMSRGSLTGKHKGCLDVKF